MSQYIERIRDWLRDHGPKLQRSSTFQVSQSDYVYNGDQEGLTANVVVMGNIRPRVGDYLILDNGGTGSRYIIEEIEYRDDMFPAAMFKARVRFAPRRGVVTKRKEVD